MFEKAASSIQSTIRRRFATFMALSFLVQVFSQTAPVLAQSAAAGTAVAKATLPTSTELTTITLAEAVSSGKVKLQVKGDGSSTKNVQMFLENKTNTPLRVVIPANQIIHPGKIGTQDMMITEDRMAILMPGAKEIVFSIETVCVSFKTIPPPTSEKIDYSVGVYNDEKTWGQFAGIIAASKDLAGQGKYDKQIRYESEQAKTDPKKKAEGRKEQQEKIAQLAIWNVLGLSSSNPEDAVTSKTIAEDTLREVQTKVKQNPDALNALLAAGGTLNKKHEFVPGPQQQKSIEALSDAVFANIDLTVRHGQEPDLKGVASLPKTPWDTYYNVGVRSFDAGELIEAGEVLEAAVKEAETFGEADARLSKSLLSMGRCFTDVGNYEGAEPTFDRALKLRQKVAGEKSIEVAEVTNDIGVLHQRQLQLDDAQTNFTQAYDIASNAAANSAGSLVAQILDNLGRNYCLLKQGDQAVTKLQQALALTLEDTKGEHTAPVAEVEANLAAAYALKGDGAKAIGLYEEASSIANKALGPDNLFTAHVLDGLASVIGSQDPKRSQAFSSQAKSVRENAIGQELADRIWATPASYDALTRMQLAASGAKEIWVNQQELMTAGALAQVNDPELKKPVTDKWAVVIGISKFQDPTIDLRYSRKDAEDFAAFLKNEEHFAADHVHVLLDNQATVQNIKSEIGGDKFLARVANPDDLVVIYLSSHGSSSKIDRRGANFFVGYDTDKKDLYATGLDMLDLTKMIKDRVPAKRVLVVLDACHSGAIIPGAKGLFRVSNFCADDIAQGSGQLVLCSSDPSQVSWESKRYENGVFTHQLIEALRKQGVNTKLSDAYTAMSESVNDEVRRDRGESQTPKLGSSWKGEALILAVPPSRPREGMPQVFGDNKNDKVTSVTSGKSMTAATTKINKSPIVKGPGKGAANPH